GPANDDFPVARFAPAGQQFEQAGLADTVAADNADALRIESEIERGEDRPAFGCRPAEVERRNGSGHDMIFLAAKRIALLSVRNHIGAQILLPVGASSYGP